MTHSLPSQSFRSAPAFEVPVTLREIVAAMPIVIFVTAIRDALMRRSSKR